MSIGFHWLLIADHFFVAFFVFKICVGADNVAVFCSTVFIVFVLLSSTVSFSAARLPFLADRTNGRAIATLLRLLSVVVVVCL